MAEIDEHIRARLDLAARPAGPIGVFEVVAKKRARRARVRKASSLALAVSVVGATGAALYSLERVLRPAAGPEGHLAFVRNLRPCYKYPNISGGLQMFSVNVTTGEQRLISRGDTSSDGMFETAPDFSPDGARYLWIDHYRGSLHLTDLTSGTTVDLIQDMVVDGARFSPDGAMIAFSAGSPPPSEKHIFVMDIPGGEARRLTEGENPIWTQDGRIAFIRTHPLIEQQTEDGVLRTPAEPTEFLVMNPDGSGLQVVYESPEDVVIVSGDWNPNGGSVVGEAVVRGNHDIYVVDFEAGIARRLTDHPARDMSPSWSPDGTAVAFVTGRWGSGIGHSEIAVVGADGSGLRRVTNDCWDERDPTWIPDQSAVPSLPVWTPTPPALGEPHAAAPGHILFAGEVDGVVDLFAVDPAGGDPINVTADLDHQLSPDWSPDRRRILFAGDLHGRGNLDIYVMEADGTGVVQLTSGPEADGRPTWSPDGSMIAFARDGTIVVMGADGSNQRPLPGSGEDGYPTWSPDGSKIAFVRDGDIYLIETDGEGLSRLTSLGDVYELSWSPDGEWLLFTHVRDVAVIRADGTGYSNLTDGPEDAYDLGGEWSPDGTEIVFASDRQSDGSMDLFVMSTDGTDRRRLAPTGFCCPEPSW